MKIIAQKPCSFEGQKFFIGDEIPASLVAAPKTLEKMGVIAIAADGGISPQATEHTVKQGLIEVIVHTVDGDITLKVTNAELSVFTDILQIGVNKAEDKQKISEMIQQIESEDLLIILDALDGRKFVKDEAQAKAQELSVKGGE